MEQTRSIRTSGASARKRSAILIHLDTSFVIRSLVPGTSENATVRGWLAAGEPVAIDAIAWTEFLCGPLSAETVEAAATVLGEPVSFGAEEASLAARLFNESGRKRGSLVDCMIAANAIHHGAALATANAADFRRFSKHGLDLVQVP